MSMTNMLSMLRVIEMVGVPEPSTPEARNVFTMSCILDILNMVAMLNVLGIPRSPKAENMVNMPRIPEPQQSAKSDIFNILTIWLQLNPRSSGEGDNEVRRPYSNNTLRRASLWTRAQEFVQSYSRHSPEHVLSNCRSPATDFDQTWLNCGVSLPKSCTS